MSSFVSALDAASMISAYAQACQADSLRIWIGVFGTEQPPPPTLDVNGAAAATRQLAALAPIRDAMAGPHGRPLNHRAILEVNGLQAGTPYRVTASAGNESVVVNTHTLPAQVPAKLDGTFNILLCSCYSQPEDSSMLVGTVVSQIMLRPDLTLMMGDQIYGDLPLFHDLPLASAEVARTLGAKYLQSWASSQLGPGGLGQVLARAPVLCVADDHEYWNNFPFKQAQLPTTWTAFGRDQWKAAALGLYEDYQLAGPAGATQRIDVEPLKILTVDMRSQRDERFAQLVAPETLHQVKLWVDDLRAARQQGRQAFGLLCSGQALFISAAEESKRGMVDAEMANYAQFEDEIMPLLDGLAQAGIPVVYATGDVHWGRVAQGVDLRSGQPMLYEVITSPSCLIRGPFIDRAKEMGATVAGWFGAPDPWPRHAPAASVPERLGRAGHFRLQCDLKNKSGHAQRGDQIAIMSFSRAGARLDFNVRYYAISADKAVSRSCSTCTYELHNY